MRRTPLRSKPAPRREAKQIAYIPRPRPVARAEVSLPMAEPCPKEGVIPEHEAYMAAVRRMRCALCQVEGYTQFCHTDLGKGMGLKTDVRLGWPGCGPRPDPSGRLLEGCHEYVGRRMTREQRRAFEATASALTRAHIRSAGLWPENLPMWMEDEA